MFSGERLRQARELRLMTQVDLAKRVGKSQGTIANIEGGFTQPPPDLAASLASHTRFPLAFFSQEKRADFPLESLMFRSRAAATRREAVAASKYAEIVFEAFQYLAGFVNTVPIQLRWLSNEPPHIAAQKTRRAFGLIPDKPIPHLIHEIERSGVVVLAIPLNLPRIDAFSAWIGEGSLIPVITICEGRPGDRLRWNVAHELGHLVLHHGAKHLSKENHRDADRFAAELLLPEEGIRRDIIPPVTLAGLAPLKAKWRVAIQAIARRAYDLSIITKRQYTYLFEQIGARGWRTKEPENLDFPAEKPRALMKMAEVAFGNQTDPQTIGRATNLSQKMVADILNGYDSASEVHQPQRHSSKVIALYRP